MLDSLKQAGKNIGRELSVPGKACQMAGVNC